MAPWGPLDSGLMRMMMMMMMKVFTLLILNGHKKMAISFLNGHLVLQGYKVLHLRVVIGRHWQ